MAAREKYDEAQVVEQLHDPQLCKSAFGKVIEGMDVVDEIATVRTDRNDRPLEPVIMDKVTVDTFGITYPEVVKY